MSREMRVEKREKRMILGSGLVNKIEISMLFFSQVIFIIKRQTSNNI